MLRPLDDTIVARASAAGGAARGIVRISGPATPAIVAAAFRPAVETGVARPAVFAGHWLLGGPWAALPCDLYLWPLGRSYTGQAVAEIHTLGSPPVLAALVRHVCDRGARLAEPGEFTLRAFLSGRIDLTQAEAILGVIEAASRRQLDDALTQLAGGLARPLHRLRQELLDLLAELEAGFDFPDEDLPFVDPAVLEERLAALGGEVAAVQQQMSRRGANQALPRVVLLGSPNVGKSSLFNALAAGAALVSHEPGTTRDYLTAELDLAGCRCQLIDTAGQAAELAAGSDAADVAIDRAAQEQALEQLRQAQAVVWCLDSTRPLDAWERRRLAASANDPRQVIALTKVDQPPRTDYAGPALLTSSRQQHGLEEVRQELRRLLMRPAQGTGIVAGTAVRCGESLRLAAAALQQALDAQRAAAGEELVAADLRTALDELGRVVGAVYTDDVLDVIFSRFCLGK